MRAYVFTDAALAKHAGRFVWLSIDTEKDQNAQFVEKFPIESWPTLMVLDSSGETPALKWAGSANVQQLEKLFDDAERALASSKGTDAEGLLAEADRLNAQRAYPEAAQKYGEALKASDPKWERRNRTVESLTIALYQAKRYPECADVALRELPAMPRGPSFANAAAMGLFCAMEDDAPTGKDLAVKLLPFAEEAVKVPGILADDRSGLYEALVELREDSGDKAGAHALAEQWMSFLESEAAKARTPEER
ncbi:MAG: thiol reductase thioredoxin, partial [Myxococcaceae bacterium]